MAKVAIYVRVSTLGQTTDRQESELISLAESKGYEIVNVYKDVMSGMKDDEERVGLHQLIKDAQQHEFDTILFSEFSRLSRKVIDLNQYIEFFRKLGIELFFQKQNLWVRPKGDLATDILLQVLAIVSRYEIELFAERVVSGKIAKLKNKGTNVSGYTAYGYTSNDNKEIIIDEEQAKVIKQIFKMYLDGVSAKSIAQYLTTNKNPTSFQLKRKSTNKIYKNAPLGEWSETTIRNILSNPIYTGKIKYKFNKPNIDKSDTKELLEEVEVINENIRIIDDETFNAVREKMQYNKQNKFNEIKRESLLKGLLICGNCGGNYFTEYQDKAIYYGCYNKRISKCDNAVGIKQSTLDGLIISNIFIMLLSQKKSEEKKDSKEKYIEQIRIKEELLISNDNQKKKVLEDWYKFFEKAIKYDFPDTKIDEYKQEVDKETNSLDKDNKQLKKEIRQLQEIVESLEQSNTIDKNLFNDYLQPNNHYRIKQLLQQYVDSVIITKLDSSFATVEINLKSGWQKSILIKLNVQPKSNKVINLIKELANEEEVKQYIEENQIVGNEIIYRTISESYYADDLDLSNENYCWIKEEKIFIGKDGKFTPKELYNKLTPTSLEDIDYYQPFEFNGDL